jgi:hypothetical protein
MTPAQLPNGRPNVPRPKKPAIIVLEIPDSRIRLASG